MDVSKNTVGLQETFEETPMWVAIFTMIGYSMLFIVGHIRDFLVKIKIFPNGTSKESEKLKVLSLNFSNSNP